MSQRKRRFRNVLKRRILVTVGDWKLLEETASRVAAGDEAAWPSFMEGLEPQLQVLVRQQKIGRLRAREDDLRNIIVAVFEKLRKHDGKTLRRYFEMQSRPSFRGWMARVVRSCAIDYLRAHPQYDRSSARDTEGTERRWVSLATLRTAHGAQGADSLVEMRAQVLRDIQEALQRVTTNTIDELAREWRVPRLQVRRLATKGHLYEPTINLLLQGFSYREMATKLGISRREVELTIEYVEDFLKSRYRSDVAVGEAR